MPVSLLWINDLQINYQGLIDGINWIRSMDKNNKVKLIECPRDAMQGWKSFIPTATKINYINALLQVGFDTIDFGSFVSPKAIPQMADTVDVLKGLAIDNIKTKLLAIVVIQAITI